MLVSVVLVSAVLVSVVKVSAVVSDRRSLLGLLPR